MFTDTYVMKLFDRSVDLAQFEEDSSLYPICRAWIRNQPHNRNLAPRNRSPSPERPKPEDDVSFRQDLFYSVLIRKSCVEEMILGNVER